MMLHAGWLVCLAAARDVWVLVEQPTNSLGFKVPGMRASLDMVDARRLLTYMGAFEHKMPKATHLYTTLPEVADKYLVRKKPKDVHATEEHHTTSSNGRWWCGGKGLKQSEEYTPAFARALVAAFEAARGEPVSD